MSSTSDTINIKGNRKVVCATYYAPESVFKIPDGLDLEDKSVVKFWGVKYNTLHICYVDGREEELEPHFNAVDSSDYKHPQETEIEDADDCNVDYSEDEDEEEESVTNKCDECKQSHPMCSRWRHEDRLCVKCCECENCLSLIERN